MAAKRTGTGRAPVPADRTRFKRTPSPRAAPSAWARASAPAFSSAARSSSSSFENENCKPRAPFAPAAVAASMRPPSLSTRPHYTCTSLRATYPVMRGSCVSPGRVLS